jgi:hypothetical protein
MFGASDATAVDMHAGAAAYTSRLGFAVDVLVGVISAAVSL